MIGVFAGESVDDCGGGYSESIAEMCEELQSGAAPLLMRTPNGRADQGASRDCLLLDPSACTVLNLNMYRFLGNSYCTHLYWLCLTDHTHSLCIVY